MARGAAASRKRSRAEASADREPSTAAEDAPEGPQTDAGAADLHDAPAADRAVQRREGWAAAARRCSSDPNTLQ